MEPNLHHCVRLDIRRQITIKPSARRTFRRRQQLDRRWIRLDFVEFTLTLPVVSLGSLRGCRIVLLSNQVKRLATNKTLGIQR